MRLELGGRFGERRFFSVRVGCDHNVWLVCENTGCEPAIRINYVDSAFAGDPIMPDSERECVVLVAMDRRRALTG